SPPRAADAGLHPERRLPPRPDPDPVPDDPVRPRRRPDRQARRQAHPHSGPQRIPQALHLLHLLLGRPDEERWRRSPRAIQAAGQNARPGADAGSGGGDDAAQGARPARQGLPLRGRRPGLSDVLGGAALLAVSAAAAAAILLPAGRPRSAAMLFAVACFPALILADQWNSPQISD